MSPLWLPCPSSADHTDSSPPARCISTGEPRRYTAREVGENAQRNSAFAQSGFIPPLKPRPVIVKCLSRQPARHSRTRGGLSVIMRTRYVLGILTGNHIARDCGMHMERLAFYFQVLHVIWHRLGMQGRAGCRCQISGYSGIEETRNEVILDMPSKSETDDRIYSECNTSSLMTFYGVIRGLTLVLYNFIASLHFFDRPSSLPPQIYYVFLRCTRVFGFFLFFLRMLVTKYS